MTVPRLPQELFCAILNHLSADEDLRACALTCRALVSPAQADLYRTLSNSSEESARLSLRKLERYPHLAVLVKHLYLREIHRPWIQPSEALPTLLALLAPYTYSLEILQRRGKLRYPRLPYSLLSRLEFIERITLREETSGALNGHVSHDDTALPIFLNHFPKLRAITFLGCFVENKAVDSAAEVVPPVFKLERIDGCCELDSLAVDWLVPALSSTKTLCISSASRSVVRLIAVAGKSLQHLEASHINEASDEGESFPNSLHSEASELNHRIDMKLLMSNVRTHATNLRSLMLTVTQPQPKHTPIQVVVRSLLLLDTHTHLQHITIQISQYGALADGTPWNELQDLLVGTRFSALRSVECCFVKDPDSVPVSSERILAAVPRLAEKKKIYVSTTDGLYH
ncbi:hypothetical protein C0991_008606 [Blastosporella zonata]|nr:hypothetical protein C0991_008606 [Blastosporella zonata]